MFLAAMLAANCGTLARAGEPPAPSVDKAVDNKAVDNKAVDDEAVEEQPVKKVPVKWVVRPVTRGQKVERIVSYVLIGGAGALAVGGIVALGYRQHYAGLWNDDSRCLVNNHTRAENCASDGDNATLAEHRSWELLLGAGALATVATGLFIASLPERHRERRRVQVTIAPGPGSVGLSLVGRF